MFANFPNLRVIFFAGFLVGKGKPKGNPPCSTNNHWISPQQLRLDCQFPLTFATLSEIDKNMKTGNSRGAMSGHPRGFPYKNRPPVFPPSSRPKGSRRSTRSAASQPGLGTSRMADSGQRRTSRMAAKNRAAHHPEKGNIERPPTTQERRLRMAAPKKPT